MVETWATAQINDAELFLEGYNMFRKDRIGGKGGEVILFIKENLAARLDNSCSDVEFEESLWCIVEISRIKLLVRLCYRKPGSCEGNNDKLLKVLEVAANHRGVYHLVIFGDLNYPEVDYNNHCVSSGPGTASDRFFDTTNDLYLVQNINEFTRQKEGQNPSKLDYVFTDEEGLIHCVNHEVPLGKSDHICITWEMIVEKEPEKSGDESKYNFWKGDYAKISEKLQDVNCVSELSEGDVNEAWKCLKTRIIDFVEDHVPKQVTIVRKHKKSEWLSKSTETEMKASPSKQRG